MSDTAEVVRELQDRFDEAERTADLDTLRDLIAEDFLSIGPRGFLLDKGQWIARHAQFTYHELVTSEVDVRSYGDTAVVRDAQHNRATWQDQEVRITTRVTQVWVKLDGRWQLVAIQFSPLDQPPAP